MGLKVVVVSGGIKLGGRSGVNGCGRGNGVVGGRGRGSIRELRRGGKLATNYHEGGKLSAPVAPVLGWNSTTKL